MSQTYSIVCQPWCLDVFSWEFWTQLFCSSSLVDSAPANPQHGGGEQDEATSPPINSAGVLRYDHDLTHVASVPRDSQNEGGGQEIMLPPPRHHRRSTLSALSTYIGEAFAENRPRSYTPPTPVDGSVFDYIAAASNLANSPEMTITHLLSAVGATAGCQQSTDTPTPHTLAATSSCEDESTMPTTPTCHEIPAPRKKALII
jgi:hypothetical protein